MATKTKSKAKAKKVQTGSGAYIRQLILTGKHDTAKIVKLVHTKFKGSKAKASDVYWNRNKLRNEGVHV